jgi:hypothetical protein
MTTRELEAQMPDPSSQPIPPYRGILAVDTERFTGNPSYRQPDLSAAIQESLRTAFDRCGMPELWERRRFAQSTGDGYLLGVYPELVPFLVHPFLDSLHEVLVEKDESLRAVDRGLRLRLRVSINIGPVPDSGDMLRDRIGTPMNATFRLLDCTARPTAEAGRKADTPASDTPLPGRPKGVYRNDPGATSSPLTGTTTLARY